MNTPTASSEEGKSEEAREIEQLQALNHQSEQLQCCPCIFTPFCAGVPLANPELIQAVQQREEIFKSEAYARINELLYVPKEESTTSTRPRPGV